MLCYAIEKKQKKDELSFECQKKQQIKVIKVEMNNKKMLNEF